MTGAVRIIHARKLWGHGRARQLLAGAACGVIGHRWAVAFDDGEGTATRRCLRGCGALHIEHVVVVRISADTTGFDEALRRVRAKLSDGTEGPGSAGLIEMGVKYEAAVAKLLAADVEP
jgi:hypothetical protein